MFAQQNLNRVVEGMAVYDSNGQQIGTVAAYRNGEGVINSSRVDHDTMIVEMEDALGGQRDFPQIVVTRLYEEGFVRVNRGMLRSDGYVFPQQIAEIQENALYLNVEPDELFKG